MRATSTAHGEWGSQAYVASPVTVVRRGDVVGGLDAARSLALAGCSTTSGGGSTTSRVGGLDAARSLALAGCSTTSRVGGLDAARSLALAGCSTTSGGGSTTSGTTVRGGVTGARVGRGGRGGG
ncbi:hypothetical protein GCM10009737_00870 [Nocardioides lentus]|uniref:Uncharacterized protein n=1 Tax=Nocardioides lentus TaxID=338077 RepID=A0ABP5A562_9ACTN